MNKKRGYEMLWFAIVIAVVILLYITTHASSARTQVNSNSGLSSEQALSKLIEGNQRYVREKPQHPDQSKVRIREVAKEQHPFAAVLGCADSRVPPEIIYDQGVGDLFVVREVGNIVDGAVLASLEYAVEHLGISLIIVLAHTRCGAIEAAIHDSYHGHLGTVVDAISPAIEQVRGKNGDIADLVVRANAKFVVEQLKHAKPILESAVKSGRLKVIAGYYDLNTGKVEMISK
jgi:carbonic anhydrase